MLVCEDVRPEIGGTYNDAKLREPLVQLLESREERLLQSRTLGSKRLEDLTVEVENCKTREVTSVGGPRVKNMNPYAKRPHRKERSVLENSNDIRGRWE